MLSFKAKKQTREPKLYLVALHAQRDGQVLIWHTGVVAFSLDTARSAAILNLQNQDPVLHVEGIKLGGWKLQNHIELSPAKIDLMLVEAEHSVGDIEDEREKQERNELMQTIVDTASRKLLIKYQDRFTPAEIGYLEDEIQKYERQS